MPIEQHANNMTVSDANQSSHELTLPSYEDIHLYKKVEYNAESEQSAAEHSRTSHEVRPLA